MSMTEEQARTVAAWYQSSGADGASFATFASIGVIRCDLVEYIDREVASDNGDVDAKSGVPFRVWLVRLRDYLVSRSTDWDHDLVAGMMLVSSEDIESVNRLRSMECNRCGRDWAMGEWLDERGL